MLEINIQIALLVVSVFLIFTVPVYALAVIAGRIEWRWKRNKFIDDYKKAYANTEDDIEYGDILAMAKVRGIPNAQVVIALDECRVDVKTNRDKSISIEKLEKIQNTVRVNSSFGDIPENISCHIDKLKDTLTGDNLSLYKLEQELQDLSKKRKREKVFSRLGYTIGIIGTAFTVAS